MTIKEAQYFKKYIDGRLNDILGAMTQQQLNTLQGQRFAARFMGDIKGQQMLPQSVFRQFLNEIDFSEAKQLHDDLVKAQGQIEQALQQAEQVSDMNSLHYTDVGGEETPFYIYIDMDDPELAGVSANDETALWQGIDRILQAKRTNNIQIVDLNINHRGLHECSYLYFSTSVVKSNRRIEHEYLWSAEGYYSRVVTQNGVTGEWEWRDTYADIAAAQTAAEAAQALANNHTELINKVEDTAGTALQTAQLAQNIGNEALDDIETLQDDIDRVDGKVNATQATVNTKAAINHTHSSISLGSASVECVNDTSEDGTSAGKVKLLAPSVEARDNEDNPIFSTGRYTKNGSTTNEKQTIIFVGNKQYQAGDGTSADIVLNGDMELYATLQSLQRVKRNRFEMPMAIEQILSKGKLLNEKVCEYLYNAIMQYYGNYDYENDGNSEALRMLSGENIYPVILSKYFHAGEETAHAQHFKPWRVEFYDEIQSYDNPEGVVSIPVIRIHIGEDFAEWLVHTGYKGLSEKVSYLEFGIGRDAMGTLPFSIYNASGTKLQEFTLI